MSEEELPTFPATVMVCDDALNASVEAAALIAKTIGVTPGCVLGLATGGTPIRTYAELTRKHREDGLDFSDVTTFNLDEYVGLSPQHPQSYRHFMQTQLFENINVDPARTNVPDGLADDLDAEAIRYEERIAAAGGIDLQLLGIGHNGHIAFNEPGAPESCRTRVVQLAPQTREKNARFFDSIEQVPPAAITMGIGTILEAKQILMLAIGSDKAEAVRRAIQEPASADHPASWLQRHSAVTYVLDRAAADKLGRSL